MKRLALIHTVDWFHMSVVTPFAKPWLAKTPGVELVNLCDDSTLKDSLAAGAMTPDVARRLLTYAQCAENAGADAIMITCTTMNSVAAMARKILRVPVFNIDEPMAREAVRLGSKIGIVATVPTSAPCTERLLHEAAAEQGKKVEVRVAINPPAFAALMRDDRAEHDRLVHAEIDQLAQWADVIALGQISLAQIKHDCGKPILQVGHSGFAEATLILFGEAAKNGAAPAPSAEKLARTVAVGAC